MPLLVDCIEKVISKEGGKQVYKSKNVDASIIEILRGTGVIKQLVDDYGNTFEQYFSDFNEYFEKKVKEEKIQYSRKKDQQNVDIRKSLELFLDLDVFFCETAGRTIQKFTIERWKNNQEILTRLRNVLMKDRKSSEDYKVDENLKNIIKNNFGIENIKDYVSFREKGNIIGQNFENQCIREKFQDFIRDQMNMESFLCFLENEDQEDVQVTIGLIERLLQKFGEDEKRLKKHFDIYQIQISNTYYEKMLQWEEPLDLDQVLGEQTYPNTDKIYPNTDKMKDFFANNTNKVEQKQNEMIALFDKLRMNLNVDTIKLLQDYSIEKKKRERLENNWKYIKDYVNPDELIKLLLNECQTINVTKNGETKKKDFKEIKLLCKSLAKIWSL